MRLTVRPAQNEEVPLVHSIMQRAYDEYRGLLNPASSDHSETVALNGGTLQRYVAQESGWFTERDNYSVGRFFPD